MKHDQSAMQLKNVQKAFSPKSSQNSIKELFVNLFRSGGSSSVKPSKVLKGVDFEVAQGEFFGIIGRNGSGKSTLLKLMAGIYQPTSGSIDVNGRIVPFIELGVGFNPELTGKENVYLNGAMLSFSESEVDAFYDEVVAFAELEEFMDKKLKNYSSGMQVRLAFAMAIQAKADILLIDEVLAVGDADFQRKCFNYFRHLKRSKTTVIFVTHDMDAVRQFCDRAMLIDDGEIKEIGSVDHVALSYTKLFIDDEEQVVSSDEGTDNDGVIQDITISIADTIAVSGSIEPKTEYVEPVLGFVVKSASGVHVLGSNNEMLRQPMGTLAPGKSYSFDWRFDNILSDGEYSVDIALLEQDGVSVITWWSDAATFTVRKETVSPYVVSPEIGLTVKKASKKKGT